MIIAISAAPPVETSELAKRLAAEHNLEIHQDPAPALCRRFGFQTLYDMPQPLQLEMREKLIVDHLGLLRTADNLLLNYSVCGFLADWMRWSWAFTPTEKWERIKSLAGEVVSRYDAVYHVDSGASRAYDGYVWFDQRNANEINSLLKYLYGELEIQNKVRAPEDWQ